MIGETLNKHYKIISLLGEGGIGEVYLAENRRSGPPVAIKVLARQWVSNLELLARFKREATMLFKLNHPNIIKLIDEFEENNQYFIVMEYISGGSLRDLIKRKKIPIELVRQIALGLCDALIRSHQLNIIHRDIKPENVLLDEHYTPKLADFGVALFDEGARMTRSGTKLGTPYYMSPEAWEGQPLDAQADIWSLGVVIFEMLTGKVPFDGDTPLVVLNKVNNTPLPDIKKLRKDVPTGLENIIKRMLTRDKSKRYKSMREVAADLERGETSTDYQIQATRIIEPSRPTNIIKYLKVVGVILLGLSIFLFGRNYFVQAFNTATPVATQKLPKTLTPEVIVQESTSTAEVIASQESTQTLAPPAVTATLNSTSASNLVSEKDGMVLVFVAEGEFAMGSFNDYPDEGPIHLVNLSDYWIDQTEVTNGMYAKCVADKKCEPPELSSSFSHESYFNNAEFENYPVIHVSWDDATAYCTWAGRRLPTESEWEKAARGTDERLYPWGDAAPNLNLLNYKSNVGDTTPVGSYPAGISVYGAFDMAGNVREWVNDWYNATYYQVAPESNPPGPGSGNYKVLRGGSWDNYFFGVRVAFRDRVEPSSTSYSIGFRCAVSP